MKLWCLENCAHRKPRGQMQIRNFFGEMDEFNLFRKRRNVEKDICDRTNLFDVSAN